MDTEKIIKLAEFSGWDVNSKQRYSYPEDFYFPKLYKGDLEIDLDEYIPHKPEGIIYLREIILSLHPDIIDDIYLNWKDSVARSIDEYEEYETSFAMAILKHPEDICNSIYEVVIKGKDS